MVLNGESVGPPRSEQFRAALAAAQDAYAGVDLRAYERELYDEETGLPR